MTEDSTPPEPTEGEKEIKSLKGQITDLKSRKNQIKIPQKTIAYQFSNMRYSRPQKNNARLKKDKRRRMEKKIKYKLNRIDLLKSRL